MQYPQFIIYLKSSKTQQFELKSDVESVTSAGKLYSVLFRNGRTYNYGADKVRYYTLKSLREGVRVYIDGKLQGQITTALDYGVLYIFASDKYLSSPIPKNSNIEICDLKDSVDGAVSTLDYFKQIVCSATTSFSSDGESNEGGTMNQTSATIITKALENIDVQERRTVLSAYIDGEAPTSKPYTKSIIFPFGCNESQKMAVERALSSNMSIVEGPPGTGKTQTVLNIVANIICDNKSVAIVSNNNAAVNNIHEKLSKNGYGSIIASLGNRDNRNAFFDSLKPLNRFSQLSRPEYHLSEIDTTVASLGEELTECFEKRNRVAKLKSQLTEAENQQRHIITEQQLEKEIYAQIDKRFHRKKALRNPFALRTLLLNGKASFLAKWILIFKYGYYDIMHLDDYIDYFPTYANHKFYELEVAAIKSEIEELEAWLESVDEAPKLKQLIELSVELFGAKLAQHNALLEDTGFNINTYKTNFGDFVKRYPVVTSSTLSLCSSIPSDYLFDYLIIDESSQVDIIKASICFARARRVVVVGDSCQLSHIVDSDSAEISELLQRKLNIAPAYNYVTNSILDSLKELYGEGIPTTLLKEHYRCHPDIIGFCNKRYYNDELVVMTSQTDDDISPFKIIESNITGSKWDYNQRQIDETERYINDNFAMDLCNVGVVSPYRTHANMLQSQLPKQCEADTIHKYQGREKDYIIFNTVVGKINRFIDNPNLINVAVSRAVKGFVMVKPKAMELPHGTNIGDLIRYIYYKFDSETVVQAGMVCSVFDILYKEYNPIYINFASKNQDIGGSPAEIIIHKLLEEILQDAKFASIAFVREYYLRDLVRDITTFSEEEVAYIKHSSRLDFLLYNKIDCSPILAIEVDGVSFHNNEPQQIRDALKNDILKKLKLPLIRLSTDGHSEKEIILENLLNAMTQA